MLPEQPLVVWSHPQTKTIITVWPTFKRRVIFSHPSTSTPDVDEWPILYRRDVPTLTDEEWTAAPVGEGWVKHDYR